MNDQQTARWHARLDEREAQLREEVRAVGQEQDGAPSNVTRTEVDDIGDMAEQATRGAVRHAEQERDIEELQAIEAARARLQDGSFGLCVDCGVAIAPARLDAQPSAARCVECQARFELNHPAGPRVDLAPRAG